MNDLLRDAALRRILINQAAIIDVLILIGRKIHLNADQVDSLETAFGKTTEFMQEVGKHE